ncbi:sensor histidine kinase [Dyadobacter sp. CY326]|uniref:sensor histidine kinase n=1 Tax=Dyadobacter sp. CY326 TaxID=2907300 RepID=UPI001F22FAA5|nr:histidine kinase [Dyadobacter sp. CY326]MCE7065144.1 histidine kinase [Dyadobacter sp. CY326]
MFKIRYRFGFMFLLGAYSFLNTLLLESFDYYHLGADQWVIFLLFLAVTAGIWEGNRLWDNWLSEKDIEPFWKRIGYNLAGSVLITALVTLILGVPTAYYSLSHDWHEWILPLKLLLMFCFRVNLFLNTIHVIFLYMKKLEESHQQLESYKRITSQAQLQSLRNQVNPHFLFNNLSVLTALIAQDTTASVEFVKQFSNVYRYILKSDEKELIELRQELSFIHSYLYLLKTRFESGLSIQVDISEGCLSAYILPVSLQMLVENAVKHNIISKGKPLHIDIFCIDNETITVKNNLQRKPIEDDQSTRLGLTNIAKRYDFLGHHGVVVEQTDKYFSVTIPLIRIHSEHTLHNDMASSD